jgi:hypothetical protein
VTLLALSWTAVALGILGCVAVLYYRRMAKRARRELNDIKLRFESSCVDVERLRQELQGLRDSPPMPSDAQLAAHLSTLEIRLAELVLALDAARISSAAPLCDVADEAEAAKVLSRKERFSRFRDTLKIAHLNLGRCVELLLAAHPAVRQLREALQMGHLKPLVGKADLERVSGVIEELSREVSLDEAWRKAILAIKNEFEPIANARQRTRELERYERLETRQQADLAFSRYKLPPLIAYEQFRAIRSLGQRDSFSV